MSTGPADAGVWLGAVWAWKNQERVSLGLTTFSPTTGSRPDTPLHLGSHGDNDRRIGRCPPPLNSGKRLGQHKGLSGKGLPAGTAHPPSLAGTCGKMCGRDGIKHGNARQITQDAFIKQHSCQTDYQTNPFTLPSFFFFFLIYFRQGLTTYRWLDWNSQ